MRSLATTLGDPHAVKCDLAADVLRSHGELRLQVMGCSMLPAVWPGDTLTIEHVKAGDIFEGDIVLFARDRRLFAHRVVSRTSTPEGVKVLTRGDALTAPDPAVSEDDLLGRVAYILRNGRRIEPRRSLRPPERVVAELVRRSEIAARVVVIVHGIFQTLRELHRSKRHEVKLGTIEPSLARANH